MLKLGLGAWATVALSRKMEALPLRSVRLVAPFPAVKVTAESRSLAGLVSGKPAVIHMYTG